MADQFSTTGMIQPAESTRKYRRLVTGFDADGQEVILEDQVCPNRFVLGSLDTMITTELWRIKNTPNVNDGEYIDTGAVFAMNPTPGGNVARIVEFPPAGACDVQAGESTVTPEMHRTASTDYAVILEGECYACVGNQERLLKAGDVLIQRGTIHAWVNRSNKPCRIFFVLCGAKEIPGLSVL